MKEKGVPSFSYKLFDNYPVKAEEEPAVDLGKLASSGYKVYDAGKARQHLPPARSVVDLHMEKICDNWQQLDSFEILTVQLNEFEKYYELAQQHRQPSLIIVHGVGTGRLRDEIHDLLKRRKEVKYFVNQFHRTYGYGATEIFFQY
jgi:hypothetical protein